jgi:hypothetical protein
VTDRRNKKPEAKPAAVVEITKKKKSTAAAAPKKYKFSVGRASTADKDQICGKRVAFPLFDWSKVDQVMRHGRVFPRENIC